VSEVKRETRELKEAREAREARERVADRELAQASQEVNAEITQLR
jgi:hypothetical protein